MKFITYFVSKDGDFSPLRLSMLALFIFGGLSFFISRNLNPTDFMYDFLVDIHETLKFLTNLSIFCIFASGAFELYKKSN